MMQSNLGGVRRYVAAVALAVAGGGAANAAEFTVNWDPIHSAAVTALVGFDLGWRGSALVTVDPSCLMSAGTFNVPSGSCLSAALNSFILEFYNNAAPLITIASYTVGTIEAITDVLVDANLDVAGINLAFGGIAITGAPFTFGLHTFGGMDLDFSIPLSSQDPTFLGPTLRLFDISNFDLTYNSATTGENAPRAVWTLVPEPATLALVGLALAALGLRRRKA